MSTIHDQRAAWRRHRAELGLLDSSSMDFASGGLAKRADPLDARIVILPADPGAGDTVALDEDSAGWIQDSHASPYGGPELSWGRSVVVTSHAIVRANWYRDDHWWERYLALHRHGGLEAGITTLTQVHGGDRRLFALRHIAGLMWIVAALQREVAERWNVNGPWQVSLALRNTVGAGLTMFAEGWDERYPWFADRAQGCTESHVLHTWELADLDPEALGLDAGCRVENSFGSVQQRHVARTGPRAGMFDPPFGW
jgi:hypothetical protein